MEQVFVVERRRFFGGTWPQGFVAAGELPSGLLRELAAAGAFVARDAAELDPAHKQLIPYCVLRRPQAVFCVQRKTTQAEIRLHRLLSIGIGGHINPDPQAPPPAAAEQFFLRALWRELDEEMQGLAPASPQPLFQGLLNDDDNEVGKVHAGLVYSIDCADPAPDRPLPRIREISKMAGGFRSLAELEPLWQDPGRFESWSRMLFQAGIAGIRAVARPLRTSARPGSAERNSNG